MAYSSKEIWIPTDRDAFAGVADDGVTGVTPIKSGTANISRGLLLGVQLSVNASSGASHKATVKVYSEAAATYLHYDVTLDLNPNTQSSDTLATPIPFFGTPHFTVTDVSGGGSKNYTVLFYVKALA
tara:strand:+ start:1466 stop:1846 length:381 start_codon:yes stop_codon:yes gene_type:complete